MQLEMLNKRLPYTQDAILKKYLWDATMIRRTIMSRNYSEQYPYGYYKGGGWDIDTSEKTQREGDSGHIPGRFQFEETVDVSADDDKDDDDDE